MNAKGNVFTLLKTTTDNLVLLESEDGEPVARASPLFAAGKRVGKIMETIGRVDSPLYIAGLLNGIPPASIAGKKLTIAAKR